MPSTERSGRVTRGWAGRRKRRKSTNSTLSRLLQTRWAVPCEQPLEAGTTDLAAMTDFEIRARTALAGDEAHAALEQVVMDELAAGAPRDELIERLKALRDQHPPERTM